MAHRADNRPQRRGPHLLADSVRVGGRGCTAVMKSTAARRHGKSSEIHPCLYPLGQLGNGEDAIPSNPVVYVTHGHR
jgi:hypothetical protein